ncbi:aspartic peptidase domain-containing protein [Mycena olivaceomarginata]|nr:aspartic peptidase domain-containing protein [Mycena olivaceomarginata]
MRWIHLVFVTLAPLLTITLGHVHPSVLDCCSRTMHPPLIDGIRRESGFETRGSTSGSQDFVLNHVQDSEGNLAGYLLSIEIGTPPQTFNVRVDTRGTDLWVGGTSCDGCPNSVSLYNLEDSSTSNLSAIATEITQYGSAATISGNLANDIAQMGEISIPKAFFLSARQIPTGLLTVPMSGEMGLGFSAIATATDTPFWRILLENGQIPTYEMAFWLARIPDSKNSQLDGKVGGKLTLGGVDSQLFSGEIEFRNLTSGDSGLPPSYWSLQLAAITVQGETVTVGSIVPPIAVFDVGFMRIGGPKADVAAIWKVVPGAALLNNGNGVYQFPCNTNVTITVSFGGKKWAIDPFDINLGPVTKGSSQCVGTIVEWNGYESTNPPGPNWIFGMTFLQNPPSIGLAQLNVAAGGPADPGTTDSTTLSSATTYSTTSSSATYSAVSTSRQGPTTKSRTGPVVGGVLGGVAGMIVLAGLLFLHRRQRNRYLQSRPFQSNISAGPQSEKRGGQISVSPLSQQALVPVRFARSSTASHRRFGGILDLIARAQLVDSGDEAEGVQDPRGDNGPDPTVLNELESIRNELRRLTALTAELPLRASPPTYAT